MRLVHVGCMGGVMVTGAESRNCKLSSNFGLVCCVQFDTIVFGKGLFPKDMG